MREQSDARSFNAEEIFTPYPSTPTSTPKHQTNFGTPSNPKLSIPDTTNTQSPSPLKTDHFPTGKWPTNRGQLSPIQPIFPSPPPFFQGPRNCGAIIPKSNFSENTPAPGWGTIIPNRISPTVPIINNPWDVTEQSKPEQGSDDFFPDTVFSDQFF